MNERAREDRRQVVRWVRAMPVIFMLLGLSFGSWLSRLPAVRDHLDASTIEMSIYGLCLASGSVVGLVVSGRVVQHFGAKRTLAITVLAQVVTLPGAVTIILGGAVPLGLIVLFAFGFVFALADVAMNVSGASAERAFGAPQLPLMHAGYSTGTVGAMALGALAEARDVPVQLHFLVVCLFIAGVLLVTLRFVPADDEVVPVPLPDGVAAGTPLGAEALDATGPIPIIDSAAGQQPAFTTMTGSIPVMQGFQLHDPSTPPAATAPRNERDPHPPRRYSPWRDPRVLLIGMLALATGLVEGTASDWLPLALVDGRALTNQAGTLMLGVFFASVMGVRLAGSAILVRFGRVPTLRASGVLGTLGIITVILVPGTAGVLLGTIAWGLGAGLGWPIAISAAADRPETAVRDVAAVSALGYGSMLIGPMAFGFLGEHIGLLTAFWVLLLFTAATAALAFSARDPQSGR